MPALSRRKGHNYERELVHVFREAMPGADIKRGLQSRDGSEVPDVDCPDFWVEAKRGKKPNVRAALRQANEANKGDRMCVAVIRDDREPAFVALSLDDFMSIVRERWNLREQVRNNVA